MTNAGQGSAPDGPEPGGSAASDTSADRPLGRAFWVVSFISSLAGTVVVGVTPNLLPPTEPLYWALIVGGAALVAFPPAYAGWRTATRRVRQGRATRFLRWLARKRVAVGIAAVLTAVLVFGVPPTVDRAQGAWFRQFGCPQAMQLRMVASPQTVTSARQLADAYERWTAGENHDCPTVDVYVFEGASEEIRERARTPDGWSDESGALREIGPQPDVWLAATSHELAGLDPAIADPETIALSPVVVAVPDAAERLTGRLDSWAELFARLTDQGVGIVRADPGSTDLGLLATALLYDQEGQYGQNGIVGPQPLAPAEVERSIAESLDEGGFPLTDTLGLLCRHRQTGSPTAIIASEQQVARYNMGDPLGESCLSRTDEPGRVVALYPSDTRSLDHQFVRFSWSDSRQEQAAAAFGEWLRTEPGRGAIVATGLRPVGPFAVGPVLTTPGIDPDAPVSAEPLPTAQWDAAAAAYDAARRRGRVLFALDTSGSMAAAAPEGLRSTVAAAAVEAALQDMGPRDEFGLWFFPDAAGTGPREVLPLGPRASGRLAAAQQLLAGVRPAGNTPLFGTMIDAAAALDSGDPAQVDAVVVLTDGEDTSSGVGADAVSAALAATDVRLIVVTIGEVRCSGSGLAALATATAGECVDADLASLGTTLRSATAGLWGGR